MYLKPKYFPYSINKITQIFETSAHWIQWKVQPFAGIHEEADAQDKSCLCLQSSWISHAILVVSFLPISHTADTSFLNRGSGADSLWPETIFGNSWTMKSLVLKTGLMNKWHRMRDSPRSWHQASLNVSTLTLGIKFKGLGPELHTIHEISSAHVWEYII